MKNTNVAEDIIKEILKDCNWVERIIIRIFYKEFVKVYNIIRIELINILLK